MAFQNVHATAETIPLSGKVARSVEVLPEDGRVRVVARLERGSEVRGEVKQTDDGGS